MTETKSISWPPEYKLKRHPRARRVKLSVSRAHGLQITIPMRFSISHIPSVLIEHEKWIIKHLSKLAEQKNNNLPDKIEFPLLNEVWIIHYMQNNNSKIQLIERAGREIVLMGNIEDTVKCKMLLIAWIKEIAKLHLTTHLYRASEKTQLYFQKACIRDQETRWGSCSREKTINLNYRLIFLPAHLAIHVMIHELCHTKYLNHSEKFWGLVRKYDVNCDENRKELRKADKYVPSWV